jgi:hypothetical protein
MFASRITAPSFNRYNIFPVDLMHEVELGMRKAVFTQLIQLLNEMAVDKVHELNKRCILWSVTILHTSQAVFQFSSNTQVWAGYHSTLL